MKTSEVKDKVAAKVAKGKAKVAAKCGKAAKALGVLLAFAAIAGCHMGELPTAQRAQTAATEVKFVVQDGATANFTFGAEFVSLAQANETSGTETMTATPQNTPTVDTRPDVDVSIPVNKENAGTSGAAGGALEHVVGAAADWVADKISGSDEKSESGGGSASSTNAVGAASN